MNFLRSHPVFSATVGLLVLFTGVEFWLLLSLRQQEANLERETEQKINRINFLQRQQPAPNHDNVLLAQEDLEQSKVVLATMLRTLGVARQDDGGYFKDEPAGDIEAYFDISAFVDLMGAAAREAGIQFNESARFGFATHVNAGPEPELISIVYRQRRILQYLLECLIAARPQRLVSVQRERPETMIASGASAQSRPRNQTSNRSGEDGGPASDFFVIDPQVSARAPGYVDTMAFRLVFVGQTSALRGFMNALAEPGLPLVVRSVEVASLPPARADADERPGRGRPEADADALPETIAANVPIVAENNAQFTVTVEMFEVQIQ